MSYYQKKGATTSRVGRDGIGCQNEEKVEGSDQPGRKAAIRGRGKPWC